MTEVNDLYLFEDDFGTILEILEDEEELDEQLREVAIEVSVSNFYSILKYQEKLHLMTFESRSFSAGAVMNFMCHSKLSAKFLVSCRDMLLFGSFFEQNHAICRFPTDCWTLIEWRNFYVTFPW